MVLEQNNPEDELIPALEALAKGECTRAAAMLKLCVQRQPHRLAAVRALASALLAQNRPEAARKTLERYTSACPMCEQGWRLAALLEWKLGQQAAAIQILQQGLRRLPRSEVLNRQMNLLTAAAGMAPVSAAPSKHEEGQGSSSAPGSRSGSDCQAGSSHEAGSAGSPDWLDRIVQDARLLEGILNTATDQLDLPMLRDVEARLAQLVEAQPGHPDRQVLLAKLRLRLGDAAGAMIAAQRALRANPGYIQAYRVRAEIATHTGDDQAAVRSLESLVSRGISWPDLHCQIARIQHRQGKLDEARAHLWEAIKIAPDYQQARDLLERCAA